MTGPEIYNTYLSVSRGSKNKPWKPRKDFTDFEKTEAGVLCLRLELFFKRFPQINPREFFLAPYELYRDEDYFELKFYLTQKAISCYTIVQKQKQDLSPDTDEQLNFILTSVKYVAEKCVTERIKFNSYYTRKNGYVHDCILDYTDNRVSIYFLLALPNFNTIFDSMLEQDKKIYFKNTYNDIVKFKTRLNNSVKAKKLLNESIKRLTLLD